MYQVIIVIHILLGLSIIGLILMQQGKGADAGAGFGGGASGSVFGAQGAASFLSRTTAIMASLFFVTSLGLAWIGGNKSGAMTDIMGPPVAVEKEVADTGLPNVDGANGKVAIPPAAPESNAGVVPTPPTPVGTAVPAPVSAVPAEQQAAPVPTAPVEAQATPVPEATPEPKAEKAAEDRKPEPKAEKHHKKHVKKK